MMKSFQGLTSAGVLMVGLGVSGCGGSSIDQGVPPDTGYVPPKMQPNSATAKGKPVLGATEKDKMEAAAKAKSESGAAGTPSP
jgi:hypothetical protein